MGRLERDGLSGNVWGVGLYTSVYYGVLISMCFKLLMVVVGCVQFVPVPGGSSCALM